MSTGRFRRLPRIWLMLAAAYGCSESPTGPRSALPRRIVLPDGVAPLVVEANVTIDASGRVNASGVAVVSGTVRCPVGSVNLTVSLSQPQKLRRVTTVVEASDEVSLLSCDGSKRFWSVALTPESGGFQPGEATASVTTDGGSIIPTETTSVVKFAWARK